MNAVETKFKPGDIVYYVDEDIKFGDMPTRLMIEQVFVDPNHQGPEGLGERYRVADDDTFYAPFELTSDASHYLSDPRIEAETAKQLTEQMVELGLQTKEANVQIGRRIFSMLRHEAPVALVINLDPSRTTESFYNGKVVAFPTVAAAETFLAIYLEGNGLIPKDLGDDDEAIAAAILKFQESLEDQEMCQILDLMFPFDNEPNGKLLTIEALVEERKKEKPKNETV